MPSLGWFAKDLAIPGLAFAAMLLRTSSRLMTDACRRRLIFLTPWSDACVASCCYLHQATTSETALSRIVTISSASSGRGAERRGHAHPVRAGPGEQPAAPRRVVDCLSDRLREGHPAQHADPAYLGDRRLAGSQGPPGAPPDSSPPAPRCQSDHGRAGSARPLRRRRRRPGCRRRCAPPRTAPPLPAPPRRPR